MVEVPVDDAVLNIAFHPVNIILLGGIRFAQAEENRRALVVLLSADGLDDMARFDVGISTDPFGEYDGIEGAWRRPESASGPLSRKREASATVVAISTQM